MPPERAPLIAVAFALITFLSTAAGGLFAVHRRQHLYLVMGAAAGLLIGAALLDLLPEAIDLARPAPIGVAVASVAGCALFYAADRLVHLGTSKHQEMERERTFGSVAALGLTIHSFFDGLAIGSAFHADARLGVVVGVAVVGHDFGDGVSTVGVVLGSRGAVRASLTWLLVDAAAPVAGALLALALHIPRTLLAEMLGFFAGSFLFLGAAHLLPEAAQGGHRARLSAVFLGGVTLAGAVTWLSNR